MQSSLRWRADSLLFEANVRLVLLNRTACLTPAAAAGPSTPASPSFSEGAKRNHTSCHLARIHGRRLVSSV